MKQAITSLFLFPIFAFALPNGGSPISPQENQFAYIPWFTGPLLAPTPINMKPGHPAIEPSVTIFNIYGKYNSHWELKNEKTVWAINPFIDFQFGITDNLGIEMLASSISNFKNGKTSTHLQDTVILFGYQVSNDVKDSWIPDCRLFLQETLPSGKYQKLDPRKGGIDSTGQGSYQTGPVIAFRKLFYLKKSFFSVRWSVGYLFPSTVHVKDFNSYGGGYGTKGKVKPGQTLIAFLSGEYSLNQRWALAFDTEFFYQRKSHFSGKRGTSLLDEVASVGLPSSVQISFAPEVEYNFTPLSGLLAGIWVTVAGKNSAAFASTFLAYVYVF